MQYNKLTQRELEQQQPSEILLILQQKKPDEICEVLSKLSEEKTAAILPDLPPDILPQVLNKIPDDTLRKVINKLPSDAAADIIGYLNKERRLELLSKLSSERAESIISLLKYAPNSAGGIMCDRFINLNINETIGQSLERIRSKKDWTPNDIAYLYVTDEMGRLVGIVQVHELLFGDQATPLKQIVKTDVKYLKTDSTMEEIEYMFSHYKFLGLPVVDESGRLVGVVRSADVVQLAEKEATKDMQLMVGLSGIERLQTPWKISIRQRLPWLYFNLATSFIAAVALGLFEETLGKWIALAVFLPVILSQGANAGMQTLTIVIREIALGEFFKGYQYAALRKELILGLLCGLATGIVVGVVGYFWKGGIMIGVVAGSAIILSQLVAAIVGVIIPLFLKSLKIDPALAASIILTTVTDVAGIVIFLGIATIAVKIAGGM